MGIGLVLVCRTAPTEHHAHRMVKPTTPFAIRDLLSLSQIQLLQALANHYLHSEASPLCPPLGGATIKRLAATQTDIVFLEKHGLHLLCSDLALSASPTKNASVRLGIAVNELQANALFRVLAEFAQRTLPPPLIFKGSAVGPLEYTQAWHRPKSDHDLLVCAQQKMLYHQALIEQGFTYNIGNGGRYISYQNSYVKKIGATAHIWIDLHWRISNRQLLAQLLTYADLAQRARSYPGPNQGGVDPQDLALAPSRADSIVLAAQHIIGHHSQDTRLLWFFELLLLIKNSTTQDLQMLVERCEQLRVAGIVLAAIEYAESLFKPTLNNTIRSQLMTLSDQPEASQILLKHPHTRARLIWWDLCAIGSWSGRLRFILEHFVPQRAYMQARFPSRWLLVSHFKRWLGH